MISQNKVNREWTNVQSALKKAHRIIILLFISAFGPYIFPQAGLRLEHFFIYGVFAYVIIMFVASHNPFKFNRFLFTLSFNPIQTSFILKFSGKKYCVITNMFKLFKISCFTAFFVQQASLFPQCRMWLVYYNLRGWS